MVGAIGRQWGQTIMYYCLPSLVKLAVRLELNCEIWQTISNKTLPGNSDSNSSKFTLLLLKGLIARLPYSSQVHGYCWQEIHQYHRKY